MASQVTAEDLLAAGMLSVRVVRYYALDVLVYQGREISGLPPPGKSRDLKGLDQRRPQR